jgi:hypothetical protein
MGVFALDGVYDGDPRRCPQFQILPPPENREMEWIARRISRGAMRLLIRRGLGPDAEVSQADPLPSEDPFLSALYSASVRSRIATGPRAGQQVLRFVDPVEGEDQEGSSSPRCVTVDGFSVHAEVGVPARDRRRLQRLCRYTGRPPLATRRLSRLRDGRLLYRLKRRWRDGTTHVVFEPLELLEKLAALVPPPRIHQVRYHGILGPAARHRPLVVPVRRDARDGRTCRSEGFVPAPSLAHSEAGPRASPSLSAMAPSPESADHHASGGDPKPAALRTTLPWAELIRRVFEVDVLECPRCGGRMRILAAIQTPAAIQAILEHLGLPSRVPPIAMARRPPQDSGNGIFPEQPEV